MEEWRPVVGWEGIYAVSSVGRLRYEQDRPSNRYAVRAGFIVRPNYDDDGYATVSLARVGERGGRKHARVAVLVAEAFVGPRPPKLQVNHKNTDRANDAADNLEWVTCLENVQHAIRVGVRNFRGEKSPSAKLTTEQVVEIRERCAGGEHFRALASAFGVSNVAIAHIATGRTWVDAPGPRVQPRDAAEKKRLGIPNHAAGVRSNRQRRA